MEFINAISLKNAVDVVKNNFIPSIIKIKTEEALNNILAEDVYSQTALPSFNRSTVDGYAVNAIDTVGSSEGIPSIFNIIAKIDIGVENNYILTKNTACYVPTGGMLPINSNSVVMIESVEVFGDTLLIKKPLAVNENVNLKGGDLQIDDILLSKGEKLNSRRISFLVSCGIKEIKIYKPIIVTILSTGDELVSLSGKIEIGKIWDANTDVLRTLSIENNITINNTLLLRDNYDDIKNAIFLSLHSSDIILISGGSSVGDKDYTYKILSEIGEILFKGIAVKPGKPTILAKADQKLILGLPGHPLACYFLYKILITDNLLNSKNKTSVFALASENFPVSPGKTSIVLVKLTVKDYQYICEPIHTKSAFLSTLSKADGYCLIEEKTEGIYENSVLEVFLL